MLQNPYNCKRQLLTPNRKGGKLQKKTGIGTKPPGSKRQSHMKSVRGFGSTRCKKEKSVTK